MKFYDDNIGYSRLGEGEEAEKLNLSSPEFPFSAWCDDTLRAQTPPVSKIEMILSHFGKIFRH